MKKQLWEVMCLHVHTSHTHPMCAPVGMNCVCECVRSDYEALTWVS